MNASEMLERLDEDLSFGPFNHAITAEGLLTLRNALPELVAVVKAAEEALDTEWSDFVEYGLPEEGEAAPNSGLVHRRVADALAALARKLEEA
jgi:hypothetical protein